MRFNLDRITKGVWVALERTIPPDWIALVLARGSPETADVDFLLARIVVYEWFRTRYPPIWYIERSWVERPSSR